VGLTPPLSRPGGLQILICILDVISRIWIYIYIYERADLMLVRKLKLRGHL
jgi:hypothetical protein